MRTKRIVLAVGGCTVDANVDKIGRELLAAFAAAGWRSDLYDMAAGDPDAAFRSMIDSFASQGLGLMLSVQEMGRFRGLDDVLSTHGARHLRWSLDHPYSGWDSVRALPPGSIVTYPSMSHVAFCRQFLRQDLTVVCAAHGAAPRPRSAWSRRDIEVLFVGNVDVARPDEMRRAWGREEPIRAAVLDGMAESWQAAPATPPEDLAVAVFKARGAQSASAAQFFDLLKTFDGWARAEVRRSAIEALAGLPVTVVGRGWDRDESPGFTMLGPRPATEVEALVGRSRILLNVLPDYYRSHERVFAGMAAGAAVLSTGMGYLANALGLEQCAGDGQAVAYAGRVRQIADRLAELRAPGGSAAGVAEAGAAEFDAHHSWVHRVRAVLAAVGRGTS